MRKMPLEIKDKKLTATCTLLYPIQVCIKIYNASVEMEITGCVIIVAFLENTTIGYSLESLCVCVCVFLHDNSKRNRSRNTKLEIIVEY